MEAKRRAIEAVEKRKPSLFNLILDNDFGWDDGLICGGSVDIFLEPRPELHAEVWKQLARPPTEKMQFRMTVESSNSNDLGKVVYAPITQHIALSTQRSTVREYTEFFSPKPVLVIAGAGHVGYATAKIAAMVDFDVVVIDDRPAYANKERFPEAKQVIAANPAEAVRDFPINDDTYICVITRGHRNDAHVLRECISSTAAYIGLIGNKRKIRKIFDEFMREGIATEKQLKRVHAPIGIDIGSVTVEEIAVSIVAQLVQVRAERRKAETQSSVLNPQSCS